MKTEDREALGVGRQRAKPGKIKARYCYTTYLISSIYLHKCRKVVVSCSLTKYKLIPGIISS